LVSLWAARKHRAAKWRAQSRTSARVGLAEKAEGGGDEATGKASVMRRRIEFRGVLDRLRYRAQDRVEVRVHVLDLVFRTAKPPSGSWR